MDSKEIVTALRRNMVETGSLMCLDCHSEDNYCSRRGCAVMREAADAIERLTVEVECRTEERDAALNDVADLDNNLNHLSTEVERLTRERDAAVRDMEMIAADSDGELKCSFCVFNPTDTGCVLDGTQFDDDSECHFTWRGSCAANGATEVDNHA